MTEIQRIKCHTIIHAASVASAGVGAGLAQLPGSDNEIITPIQLGMIISLGQVFGVSIRQSAAESALASSAACVIGRCASQVLIGWVPGIGNIVNACTAASLTEAIGWMIANQFEQGIL